LTEKTSLNDNLWTGADVNAHDRPIAYCIGLRVATCPFGIRSKNHPNGAVVTPVRSTRVRACAATRTAPDASAAAGDRRGGAIRRSPARRAAYGETTRWLSTAEIPGAEAAAWAAVASWTECTWPYSFAV
jgi:hypothetical protein